MTMMELCMEEKKEEKQLMKIQTLSTRQQLLQPQCSVNGEYERGGSFYMLKKREEREMNLHSCGDIFILI